ncbi:MAG: amidohydrolase family protein [Candidatus Humimicrobiaceae bacterium]
MIDFHTHPFMIQELTKKDSSLARNIKEVFGFYFPLQPLKVFLLELEASGIDRAVILPLDCTTSYGCTLVSNIQIAELTKKYNCFIGFASIDPKTKNAPQKLEKDIKELGLRGLKLDPSLQQFDINDKNFAFPVYQICQELDIPVMIHCGLSWAPKGLVKYASPLGIEEVAQAFPKLKIIIPHFGWPWYQESVMLAMKFQNIYIDTSIVFSGTPKEVLQHVLDDLIGINILERNLHFQILFGSNYPRADIRRSVRGLNALQMSGSLREHIFSLNAEKLLKLEK